MSNETIALLFYNCTIPAVHGVSVTTIAKPFIYLYSGLTKSANVFGSS
jgi:hypothetical protein